MSDFGQKIWTMEGFLLWQALVSLQKISVDLVCWFEPHHLVLQ
jgi:hypothetical protein